MLRVLPEIITYNLGVVQLLYTDVACVVLYTSALNLVRLKPQTALRLSFRGECMLSNELKLG